MPYKIVRYYEHKKSRVIKSGLTLKEAKKHCMSPKSQGKGWFDGFRQY